MTKFATIDREHPMSAILKVVGVGGGGCNAIDSMILRGLDGVEYVGVLMQMGVRLPFALGLPLVMLALMITLVPDWNVMMLKVGLFAAVTVRIADGLARHECQYRYYREKTQ